MVHKPSICSMYGIFAYTWRKSMVNVGRYSVMEHMGEDVCDLTGITRNDTYHEHENILCCKA